MASLWGEKAAPDWRSKTVSAVPPEKKAERGAAKTSSQHENSIGCFEAID
jgi:hypothetical protein